MISYADETGPQSLTFGSFLTSGILKVARVAILLRCTALELDNAIDESDNGEEDFEVDPRCDIQDCRALEAIADLSINISKTYPRKELQ